MHTPHQSVRPGYPLDLRAPGAIARLIAFHQATFGDARMGPPDPPADPPKDPPADPPADPPKDPPKDPPADPPADPPWKNDKDFDPDKAWKLITNLRDENKTVKTDRDKLKGTVDEIEKGKLTAQERAERERDEAKTELGKKDAELARLRAGIKYRLDEDDLELIGGGTADEIDAKAKRLSERIGATSSTSNPSSRRPRERLKGGVAPDDDPEETDPKKLAEQILGK